MSVGAMHETVDPRPFAAPLLPIMGVVFVGFLIVGVAMPVLPLYVTTDWGLARSWSASWPAVSSPHR